MYGNAIGRFSSKVSDWLCGRQHVNRFKSCRAGGLSNKLLNGRLIVSAVLEKVGKRFGGKYCKCRPITQTRFREKWKGRKVVIFLVKQIS